MKSQRITWFFHAEMVLQQFLSANLEDERLKKKKKKNSQNLFSRLAGYPVSDLTFLIYSSPPCLIIAWSPCRDADFLFITADISQMLFCVDPLQCVMYNILMRWNGYSMFPSQTHSSNEKVCHLCLEDPSSSFVWLLPVQWCCMLNS